MVRIFCYHSRHPMRHHRHRRCIVAIALCLLTGAVGVAADLPDVPDPLGLGRRLALVDLLQDSFNVHPPPGSTEEQLDELYRQALAARADAATGGEFERAASRERIARMRAELRDKYGDSAPADVDEAKLSEMLVEAHASRDAKLLREVQQGDAGFASIDDGEADAPKPGADAPKPGAPAAADKPKPRNNHAALLAAAGRFLVMADGSAADTARIARQRFVLLYFSAHWCPPCRAYTPELVKFYNANRQGDRFDIIFVSWDHDATEMAAYMKDMAMPWPAVAYEHIADSGLKRFEGRGIPCLVLLGPDGKMLSHSYVNGTYVGPNAVISDLGKALQAR
jgi:thiol-disulfide isomerase/thioredoxin